MFKLKVCFVLCAVMVVFGKDLDEENFRMLKDNEEEVANDEAEDAEMSEDQALNADMESKVFPGEIYWKWPE